MSDDTTAPPTPTGRRLVELLICQGPTMVSARDFTGYAPSDAGVALDKLHERGDILPPGIAPEFAAHLIRGGLVTPITVRI